MLGPIGLAALRPRGAYKEHKCGFFQDLVTDDNEAMHTSYARISNPRRIDGDARI